MAKRGPKPIELDSREFEKLCEIQCTQREIAFFFDVSVDTLERWSIRTHGIKLAELHAQKREKGQISLRRAQWQSAIEDKVPSLLIWLGKQYLDQKDKQDIDLKAEQIKIIIDKEDAGL